MDTARSVIRDLLVVCAGLGGIALLIGMFDDSAILHDIQRRVSHLEAQMEEVLIRIPGTGRPSPAAIHTAAVSPATCGLVGLEAGYR